MRKWITAEDRRIYEQNLIDNAAPTYHYKFLIKRAQFCEDIILGKDIITDKHLYNIKAGDTVWYAKGEEVLKGTVVWAKRTDIRDIVEELSVALYDYNDESTVGLQMYRRWEE